MKSQRAWTLPEVLVVSVMTAVVLLIVSGTLASTARLTHLESQRGFALGQLHSTFSRVEALLQRSCTAGVDYLAPSSPRPALLAIHPQNPAPYVTSPLWEAYWICLSWSPALKEIRQWNCPPQPVGVAAPRTQLPIPPTAAEMLQIASSTSGRRHLLCSQVTLFDVKREVGPLLQVHLELEIDEGRGRVKKERLEIHGKIYLRNRV